MRRIVMLTLGLAIASACRCGEEGEPTTVVPREPEPATPLPGAVEVPAGRALVGAQASEPSGPGYDPDARAEEGPVTQVDVPAFRIGSTEVSVEAWQRCVQAGACRADDALGAGPLAPSQDPGLPVAGITAAGAERLCAFLGGRLPTRAEWALAARGPEGRRYPWGSTARCEPIDAAWASQLRLDATRAIEACPTVVAAPDTPADVEALCADPMAHEPEEIVERLRAVTGSPPPPLPTCTATGPSLVEGSERVVHPLGLRWLAGNVREWTSDTADGGRVVVGGSFLATTPLDQRAAAVAVVPPELQLPDVGVRCAW